jgi:hypothetical protein
MNRSLDLVMITNPGLSTTTRHNPELPATTRHSSQTGHPKSLSTKLLKDYQQNPQVTYDKEYTQTNSCKTKQYYPCIDYPSTILRLQGRINQF